MAKIIKFPTGEDITNQHRVNKSDYDIIAEKSDECIAISQELLSIMEEFICTGQVSEYQELMNMNFRDEAMAESRDMFVVVNMINAMLNRYMGIPHRFQRDLDKAYIKLKMMPLGGDDGET